MSTARTSSRSMSLGVVGDVDTNLGQGLSGQVVDGGAGLGASRVHLHGVACDLAHQPAAICDLPPFLTQTNSTDGVGSDSDIRRRG